MRVTQENVHFLTFPVWNHPKFQRFPASLSHHHTNIGGLSRHTNEVVNLVQRQSDELSEVDRLVVKVAATWHDFGKVFEYAETDGWFERIEDAGSHIDHGIRVFSMFADHYEVDTDFKDAVIHCIASHHGKLEWGAKVVPNTLEAVVLHYADMTSMLNDLKVRDTLGSRGPLI